jgi:hypothetical protein
MMVERSQSMSHTCNLAIKVVSFLVVIAGFPLFTCLLCLSVYCERTIGNLESLGTVRLAVGFSLRDTSIATVQHLASWTMQRHCCSDVTVSKVLF